MIFMNMNHVYIYILIDPTQNKLRYVGKTTDTNRRFRRHLNERFISDTHKDKWIRKLMDSGYKPQMEIIDKVPDNDWEYWEKFYIQYFKYIGCELTNSTKGGDQPPSTKGRKHTLESRKKMSDTKKGKPIPWLNNGDERTESHRKNLSISLKGRKSPNKGLKFDENRRKKLSDSSTTKKKVRQLDLDGNLIKVWNSIRDAEKTLQIRHISEVCRNIKNYKTSGGFKWEYELKKK